jgi:hypothetical protein
MLGELSQTGIRVLFTLLEVDIDVTRELISVKPANRLKELMEIIKEKTMLPKQKELYNYIIGTPSGKIANHFKDTYWKLVK